MSRKNEDNYSESGNRAKSFFLICCNMLLAAKLKKAGSKAALFFEKAGRKQSDKRCFCYKLKHVL